MVWTTPDFEQISLSCEINSYAPAEICPPHRITISPC